MARIKWDQSGQKEYSTGVKQGVLFNIFTGTEQQIATRHSRYNMGVAWNGLTTVTETPGGAEASDIYADDIKYGSFRGAETFSQTIEAYMAPKEWDRCDGMRSGAEALDGVLQIGQQEREVFGMAHVVTKGNDTKKNDFGFEIHLAYNMTASPSEKAHATINENPEAATFSWECIADPVTVAGNISGITKPTANVVITATQGNGILKAGTNGGWDWNYDPNPSTATAVNTLAGNIKALYDIIFGRDQVTGTNPEAEIRPTLPDPGTVYAILTSQTVVDPADYAIPAGV